MDSKITSQVETGASAARKCPSWIESFAEFTDNLHAPTLFRKWAAISTIGAVLEQKVWLSTSSAIYPNLYVLLTGHPGTGKTRTIRAAKAFLDEIPEFHFAPNSFTWASLVDSMVRAKRTIVRLPDEPLEYNTLTILADEIGTFLSKYEREMSDGISAFYDPTPYGHERRGNDVRIKIKSPQLNLLCGLTPSTMLDVIPESAWGQGLMSRMVMIFSDEHILGDDFEKVTREIPTALVDDLKHINSLTGEFKVTEEYKKLVYAWRENGEAIDGIPKPSHPKLLHYNSRRRVNLYKLSMIASIDKSDVLLLDREAFNTAMGWLLEAESHMPEIFKAGAQGADGKVMEEILHFIRTMDSGKGVAEHSITRFASERLPIHTVMRVIEVLEKSGQIAVVAIEKRTGMRRFALSRPQAD
jgi:hypothetical protein